MQCYEALDERLFVNYIEEKANPIIGSLEQNMYTGRFDWGRCLRPTGKIRRSLFVVGEKWASVVCDGEDRFVRLGWGKIGEIGW